MPLTENGKSVSPRYAQETPNEPIAIGEVDVEFEIAKAKHRTRAVVQMRFAPSVRLTFTLPIDSSSSADYLRALVEKDAFDGKLNLVERGMTLDVFVTNKSTTTGMVLVPTSSPATVTSETDAITEATFHLFNFPEFFGRRDTKAETATGSIMRSQRLGRILLRADGWDVEIAATPQTAEVCKTLKRTGGYAITHVGRIARADGGCFSSGELCKLRGRVHAFLSFGLGCWSGVELMVGIDKSGQTVFEDWGATLVSAGPWHADRSWFDAHHPEILESVFPGFIALWNDPLWFGTLQKSLYWYLQANACRLIPGPDAGIILAQAALERLAWNYCVNDRKLISKGTFGGRKIPAADKLNLLLVSLGIPTAIPSGLARLGSAPGEKCEGGPEAIAKIRNSLVHPDPKDSNYEDLHYDAWKLSLWYLELVILKLCGHNGSYANRMAGERFLGQVEIVPWAKSSKTSNGGKEENGGARPTAT